LQGGFGILGWGRSKLGLLQGSLYHKKLKIVGRRRIVEGRCMCFGWWWLGCKGLLGMRCIALLGLMIVGCRRQLRRCIVLSGLIGRCIALFEGQWRIFPPEVMWGIPS